MASSKGSAKKSTKSTEANAGLPAYTVPSLTLDEGAQTAQILQARLHALIDLALTEPSGLARLRRSPKCPVRARSIGP